jgi:hypothetical protein
MLFINTGPHPFVGLPGPGLLPTPLPGGMPFMPGMPPMHARPILPTGLTINSNLQYVDLDNPKETRGTAVYRSVASYDDL